MRIKFFRPQIIINVVRIFYFSIFFRIFFVTPNLFTMIFIRIFILIKKLFYCFTVNYGNHTLQLKYQQYYSTANQIYGDFVN